MLSISRGVVNGCMTTSSKFALVPFKNSRQLSTHVLTRKILGIQAVLPAGFQLIHPLSFLGAWAPGATEVVAAPATPVFPCITPHQV
jgi:hypothetical protein